MKKFLIILSISLLVGCQDNTVNIDNLHDTVEVTLPDDVNQATINNEVTSENDVEDSNETINQNDGSNNDQSDVPQDEVTSENNPSDEDTPEIVDEVLTIEDELATWTVDEIRWLQESLKISGHYTALDGGLGQDTKRKLEDFMTEQNIDSLEDAKQALQGVRETMLAPELGNDFVLINKNYYLPSTFIPDNLRLVDVSSNKPIELPDHVALQVEAMFAAAKADNLDIVLASGYRSYDYQEGIFSRRVANHGFEEAEKVVAIPGESEHQTGLAIDITSAAMSYGLDQTFDQEAEFEWMMAHCHEYGFILRYLKEKQDITEYVYEPWHYRYIGDAEIAKYIMEQGLTYDEYYEMER